MKLLYHKMPYERIFEILTSDPKGAPPTVSVKHIDGMLIDIGVYKIATNDWAAEYYLNGSPYIVSGLSNRHNAKAHAVKALYAYFETQS